MSNRSRDAAVQINTLWIDALRKIAPTADDMDVLHAGINDKIVEQIILAALDRDDAGLVEAIFDYSDGRCAFGETIGDILTNEVMYASRQKAVEGLTAAIAAYRGRPVVDRAETWWGVYSPSTNEILDCHCGWTESDATEEAKNWRINGKDTAVAMQIRLAAIREAEKEE